MSHRIKMLLIVAVIGSLSCSTALAADSSEEVKNGIRYRVTRHTIQRAVPVTEYRDQSQVVYRSQVTTDTYDSVRTYQTPVTEYKWVTEMHGRWNPFVQPYYSQKLVPVTRWEPRTEVVSTPVTRHELVPQVQTVKVPVTRYRVANEEVVSRVPIDGVGGLARLDNDPPRTGSQLPTSTDPVRR